MKKHAALVNKHPDPKGRMCRVESHLGLHDYPNGKYDKPPRITYLQDPVINSDCVTFRKYKWNISRYKVTQSRPKREKP